MGPTVPCLFSRLGPLILYLALWCLVLVPWLGFGEGLSQIEPPPRKMLLHPQLGIEFQEDRGSLGPFPGLKTPFFIRTRPEVTVATRGNPPGGAVLAGGWRQAEGPGRRPQREQMLLSSGMMTTEIVQRDAC